MTLKETFLNKLALEGQGQASNWLAAQSVTAQLRNDTFFDRSDWYDWMREIIQDDCLGLFEILWQEGCPLAESVLYVAAQAGDEVSISAAVQGQPIPDTVISKIVRLAVVNKQHGIMDLVKNFTPKYAADLQSLLPRSFIAARTSFA